MNDYLALMIGFVCAGLGGELFVRGVVDLAHRSRISPGLIGVTVAAFGTSSPELFVGITSALAGRPQISFGDVLGSNIVNVALILALALVISGIQSPRDSVKRDFPAALLVPVITGVLLLDGALSRTDGVLLAGLFLGWLATAVIEARKQRSAAAAVLGKRRWWLAVPLFVVGLGLLFAAGNLIVAGARGIAVSFGLGEFVIGATIVAVGTSVPEMATTIMAKLRGHEEVGLGTILGSNIFNGLLIVSVASMIHPIVVGRGEAAVALAFGIAAVACTFPPRSGFIGPRRGVLLLALYAIYLASILTRQAAQV